MAISQLLGFLGIDDAVFKPSRCFGHFW